MTYTYIMGQDTYADIGVAVEIALTFDNLAMIIKVLETIWDPDCKFNFNCYCYPFKNDDEHYDFIDQVKDFIENKVEYEDDATIEDIIIFYLMNIKTKDEFDNFIEGTELEDGSPIHFIANAFDGDARNLHRREHSSVCELSDTTADDLIHLINNIKNLFIKIGFTSDQIKISCCIADYY